MKRIACYVVASLCTVPLLRVQGVEASIEAGRVRGSLGDSIVAFKGIPYAAPPVGELRWRAPQPVKAWTGVRPATAYSADCMSAPFPGDAAPLGTAPAEDFLYANVWRPAASSEKLPVLVWIYGAASSTEAVRRRSTTEVNLKGMASCLSASTSRRAGECALDRHGNSGLV